MDHKKWFDEHESVAFFGVSVTSPIGSDRVVGMSSYQYSDHTEEMYQAFKARMISELRVTSDEFLNFAELRDISQ